MAPSLRILHVTPYYDEAWAYGGIPRVASTLARTLAQRGHRVTVCTTDVRDASSRLSPPGSRWRRQPWHTSGPDDVEVRVFPNVSNRLAYHQQLFVPLGLGAYLRSHAAGFDVAHLHACRNLPAVLAARHLRRAGVSYVVQPHGTAPAIERRQRAKWLFDLSLGRGFLKGAAAVIAVSDAERRQLAEIGVPGERVRLIPNPIDLTEFEAPLFAGAFRQQSGISSSRIILFLGKLTPRKRVDVLLKAFAVLRPDATALVIAGNDMGAGTELRRLAGELGLENTIRFEGLLRGRARLEALADATVVVYPSKDEIFGLVPLEALLCGTPVIVADDSGCAEVVAGVGGGRIVAEGDPRALVEALRQLLASEEPARQAAREAGERIRQLYAPEIVCRELEALYREAVLRSGSPGRNQSAPRAGHGAL